MSLLCIVAHPDDAGIFCGGTLAKHSDSSYCKSIPDRPHAVVRSYR